MVSANQIYGWCGGLTPLPGIDFALADQADGNGAAVILWNTAKLGPQPTPAQLAAVTQAQITAAEMGTLQAAAGAAMLNARDVTSTAARADSMTQWTQINNIVEGFVALLQSAGITIPSITTIANQIASNRIAAGNNDPSSPTAASVATAILAARTPQAGIVAAIGATLASGAANPGV